MPQEKSASLFFTEGSSDKVYQAQLLTHGSDLWSVEFQYGRRGSPLKAGVKIRDVDYVKAEKVYDKLVSDKMKKGYTPEESGIVFAGTKRAGEVTGFRPQLLNEIDHEKAAELGDDWLVQEKHDGERRGLIWDDGSARYANRRGLEVGVQVPIDEAFRRLGEIVGGPLVLDAEDMGDHVQIFDVVEHFMLDNGTFRERAAVLENIHKTIVNNGLMPALQVDIPTPAPHFFAIQVDGLHDGGAEGYVLRHVDSLYEPGRPSSGGEALKVKFWADASARVAAGRDGKRSVGLEMLDEDGNWTRVGNVTIPADREVPEIGAIVDVKYLYAYEGGSLFQPTFKGVRTDIPEEECRIDRLKFKWKDAPNVAENDSEGPSL